MAKTMRWFDWIAYILITAGAIFWGAWSIWTGDFVNFIGEDILRGIAGIVGIAGLFAVYTGIKLAVKK